jgi:hypothetical protein
LPPDKKKWKLPQLPLHLGTGLVEKDKVPHQLTSSEQKLALALLHQPPPAITIPVRFLALKQKLTFPGHHLRKLSPAQTQCPSTPHGSPTLSKPFFNTSKFSFGSLLIKSL